MNRPTTQWLCPTCGTILIYRSRHRGNSTVLDRYYICTNVHCDKIWKSEERLTSFKFRGVPK